MPTGNNQTASQMRETNIKNFGSELGELYTELWQDLARLHLKNTEFLTLFEPDTERYKLLNHTSPKFFNIIQDSLWNDILLGICRISDKPSTSGKANLTVRQLAVFNKQTDIASELKQLLDLVNSSTEFARDWRNRHIAHRDLSLALDQHAKPLAEASLNHVTDALTALDKVLNLVSNQYQCGSTAFGHDISAGQYGARDLLFYLKEGLAAVESRKNLTQHPPPI